jgi:hypothetical protein
VAGTIDSGNPGLASATLQLPAGFAAGSYALTASYSGPFTGGTAPAARSATLTVQAPPAPASPGPASPPGPAATGGGGTPPLIALLDFLFELWIDWEVWQAFQDGSL